MEIKQSSLGKPLSVVSLVMINIIAVDSLRSLTAGAEYGFALVFFYCLAAILFFIPTILVSAELATGWPNTGGVYVWVREAFGLRAGFLTIWLQWIYNVVWYPTIFAFIAGVIAYLVDPALINNKIYMLSVILSLVWLLTIINCMGIRVSSILSSCGAVIGTLIPMVFIASLGVLWAYQSKPSQIQFHMSSFFPNLTSMDNLAFLTNVLFGFMGMEMSAVHAGDVKNPKRDYPKALLISGLIIFLTLVLASLAIAIVIPAKQLNLVSGLLDAFKIFFDAYHLGWCTTLIGIFIILGSISSAAAWMMGPARGLFISTSDNDLPKILHKTNRKNMPVGILITQAVIVTILCSVFLVMPTVNSSYWVLSNLTAQVALIFYIMMFAAAIRLRYKHPHVARSFRVPGGKIGIWVVSLVAIITCIITIMIGFLPPSQIQVGKVLSYEMILMGGIIALSLPAFFLHKKRH